MSYQELRLRRTSGTPERPIHVGHSAIEMTMNIYGYVNLDTQRAALDHLDEQLTD